MAIVRTPEERFEDLPGFPWEPSYAEVGDLRMAYVDAGDPDADETFLCLHGEPTWSYLYRKTIPRLSEAGRVIAPDFPGFGRSDKYDAVEDYTFGGMYDALVGFLEAVDPDPVTLVCQDWGGILGLLAATRRPGRVARLVPMNTGLPDGTVEMPRTWHEFHEFVTGHPDPPVEPILSGGTITQLSDAVVAAYEAPFPGPEYKAGMRALPGLVPTDPDDEGADAVREARDALADWEKPAFVLFSDSDPITHGSRDVFRDLIPTASEQPDVWIEGAGHFLQEDAGEAIADHVVEFVERT